MTEVLIENLKDNYRVRHVKGQLKVFCHLMFGVIAVSIKQLFNMLEYKLLSSINN